MTNDKQPIDYEEIETIPVRDLLALSHAELLALIRQAEVIADHAQNIASWLGGIRIEKTLREKFDDHGKGGEA